MTQQHAPDACDKGPEIRLIQKEQAAIRDENKQILSNQKELVAELKASFQRLESILIADVEHKKDIEQLKKDCDGLGEKVRTVQAELQECKEAKAKMDGMGIMQRFPKVWDFYQSHSVAESDFKKVWEWYLMEQGWRRFFPALMTFVSLCIALYSAFN